MALGRTFLTGALVASLASCASFRLVQDEKLNTPAINRIVREVARQRNLPLKGELPVELVDRNALRTELLAQFEAEVEPEKLEAQELLFKKLGLMPGDLSLRALMLDMLTEQIAGYYDPELKRMRLVDGNSPSSGAMAALEVFLQRDLAGEFLLAHELTHALGDQHFDLKTYLEAVEENADALMARKAFVEGDAMLVGVNYVLRRPMRKAAFRPSTGPEEEMMESWNKVPEAVRRVLLFSYIDGLRFAGFVFNQGGTDALDQVYTKPPASSEQVLHPEKYWAGEDQPVAVQLAGDIPEMAGLKLVEEDTMGEVGVQALLLAPVGKLAADMAAAGWGGDRYRLYRREGSADDLGLFWSTVWDSRADRAEFHDTVRMALVRRYGEPVEAAEGASRWETPDGTYELRQVGKRGVDILLIP